MAVARAAASSATAESTAAATASFVRASPDLNSVLYRRKLNLKAEVESSMSHLSFKRLVPGGSDLGFIRSTCTALPC